MSGLADLKLRTAYRKSSDDIAADFYLPCMHVASRYDRAVGFFNSAIYAIAWPSLKDFVARGAKMRLICSPVLPPGDIAALEQGYSERFEEANAERLRDEIRYMLSMPFLHKPATVLATLVAMGVVDVRIAFMKPTQGHRRLFHDKLGIFSDANDNAVAFKGSMNETWSGLSSDGNLESVDVFLSWADERESTRVNDEAVYFGALWDNKFEIDDITVKEFPKIARDELVSNADAKRWPELVDEICREIEASKKFEGRQTSGERRTLRPHQSSALQEWEKRDRKGIFEHATGSGKTFTAICAIRDSLGRGEIPLVLVPSELLLAQWDKELTAGLADVEPKILRCGAGHVRWKEGGLLGAWSNPGSASPRIILATMQTAASPQFCSGIRRGSHLFMVADEVHRTGSTVHQQLLTLDTGPRLGLSATPRRAGDPEGTAKIFDYFNGVIPPPFTLQDAIKAGTLTPYFYHVSKVSLTDIEQETWDEITVKLRRLAGKKAASKDSSEAAEHHIKRLLIERARILKQAEGKIVATASIFAASYRRGERWIVYCDDLNQLAAVRNALAEIGVETLEYHSAMPGDKAQTIRLFETNGGIVVSIRCLDEGIDIPSVTHALILASSKNPREYIQRRGRVLRTADHKSVAHIHDVIVVPSAPTEGDKEIDPRANILAGEIIRSIEFGKTALNPSAMTDLHRIALGFSNDYISLINSGYEDDDEQQ
jgi:superfamily II DNA or RNA helicase